MGTNFWKKKGIILPKIPMTQKDFWTAVLKRIRPTMARGPFLTWFHATMSQGVENGVLTINVPNVFAKNQLSAKFNIKILQAAQEIDGTVKEIVYKIDGSSGIDPKAIVNEEEGKIVRKIRNANEVTLKRGEDDNKILSKILNNRYTLNSFVTGDENKLPHAVCAAVAKLPGGLYNPLYIYGKVGIGKTHLLQGIGNQVLQNFPDMIVKYITAERFVTEVVEAIGTRQTKKFKDQYRNVDCFLIDDVQFLARKSHCQEELFHTINELHDRNKQIVFTSDKTPSELKDLDQRLTSRFGMGMIVELFMPDFETRLAILHHKCRDFEILIDPEVLSFIATNVQTSVRELEGVLRQIVAESEVLNSVTTIRSVAAIIKRMNNASEIIGFDPDKIASRRVKSAMEIISAVATYFNLTVEDIMGQARHSNFMMPRQISMYLIKNELGESYEKIGASFCGRNHTTVMHAYNKTARKLRTDLRLVRDINSIKKEMGL